MLAALPMFSACALDNGLPGDLSALLKAQGLEPRVLARHGPLRVRSGYLLFQPDPRLEQAIIRTFGLTPDAAPLPEVSQALALAGVVPTQVWGVTGRPAALALPRGAQLEYLYLVTTPAKTGSWLLAAYAYG